MSEVKYDCEVVQDLLPLYQDGACSDNSRKVVEEHLKDCSGCRDMAEKLKNYEVDERLIQEKENILRLNKGKKVRAYVSYPDSIAWKDKIYDGIIEEAGRDHLIISDPKTGMWFMIRMIYLNYVEFDEKINYSHVYSEKNF